MDSAIIQTNAGTLFINVVLFIAYWIDRWLKTNNWTPNVGGSFCCHFWNHNNYFNWHLVLSHWFLVTELSNEKDICSKTISNAKYLFISAVSLDGRDLIALNVWHYLDAKMANAITPTLAIVLQDGKDISATNLIVGKYIP